MVGAPSFLVFICLHRYGALYLPIIHDLIFANFVSLFFFY